MNCWPTLSWLSRFTLQKYVKGTGGGFQVTFFSLAIMRGCRHSIRMWCRTQSLHANKIYLVNIRTYSIRPGLKEIAYHTYPPSNQFLVCRTRRNYLHEVHKRPQKRHKLVCLSCQINVAAKIIYLPLTPISLNMDKWFPQPNTGTTTQGPNPFTLTNISFVNIRTYRQRFKERAYYDGRRRLPQPHYHCCGCPRNPIYPPSNKFLACRTPRTYLH